MKSLYFILTLFALLMAGCDSDTEVLYPDPFYPDQEQFRSSLFVEVVNKSGQPVANTTIRIGNYKRKTDVRGFVYMKDVLVGSSTYLVAENSGYFHASRRFYPTSGSSQYIKIIMLPFSRDAIFSTNDETIVSLHGDVRLHFPKDAYEYLDGQPYEGKVVIAAEVIPADDPDLSFKMPGDLTGVNANGETGSLASMGMVAVEMQSSAGNRLKLKDGAHVQMVMTLPSSMQGFAPATIPMWYFNEDSGLWEEEGSATLSGGVYTANVSHFSYWNYDAWFPAIKWGATFDFGNRGFANQVEVCITIISMNTTKCSYTNEDGMVCGLVAANELLLMEVKNECGNVIYSEQIGPFSDSTMIGPITLSDPGIAFTTVSGFAIDCNGGPATNGYAQISIGPIHQNVSLDEITGMFNATLITCEESSVHINLVDLKNKKLSGPIIFTYAPVINADTITVCETIHELIDVEIVGFTDHYYFLFPRHGEDQYNLIFAADSSQQGSHCYLSFLGDNPGVYTSHSNNIRVELPGKGWFYCDDEITITIAEFGAVGEYITGTFVGTCTHGEPVMEFPMLGSFSVLREE